MGLKQRARGAAIAAYLGNSGLRRRWEGVKRGVRRGRSPLTFYHRVDDPYSALLAQALPRLLDAFPLELEVVVVPAPAADVDPEPQLRERYDLGDATNLARYLDLNFPETCRLPEASLVQRANAIMLHPRPPRAHLDAGEQVSDALFRGDGDALAAAAATHGAVQEPEVSGPLEKNYAALRRAGHYRGGMLHYAGEWYWGVDRVAHLERRLLGEGLPGGAGTAVRRRPPAERPSPGPLPEEDGRVVLEMYWSFRSPYSYIVLPRIRRLLEEFPVTLRIRPVLPMVMRGLPVPRAKRLYIVRDAKREADQLRVPFGRICDPVGVGVERCMAIFPHADREGRGLDFVEAVARGVWSEAQDVAVEEDLARLVRAAGLDWVQARACLGDESWREMAEGNRRQLLAQGMWGVPSFAIGEYRVWGQDRLWILEDRIRRHLADRG